MNMFLSNLNVFYKEANVTLSVFVVWAQLQLFYIFYVGIYIHRTVSSIAQSRTAS